MSDFRDGLYRFETQVDDDDDFVIPEVIEYYIWGVHNADNIESSLIGYHELRKEDFAAPSVKTHDYNDVASIITLVENERTKKLLNERFHEGERFFRDLKTFLEENEKKSGKIAIMITDVPIQLAKKEEALKLMVRAKPDIVIADLKMVDFKRQFEYFGGNKRFTGKIIAHFSGNLEANRDNSTKSNVTYKIAEKKRQMADKKSFTPEFKIEKGDAIRESLVFFISKEFDLIRDDLDHKFDRIDASGHSKSKKMKSAPKLPRVCGRCENVGIKDQRHSLNLCPTVCMSCKTLCKNGAHCRKILRNKANEAEIEKYRKKRRENDGVVTGF